MRTLRFVLALTALLSSSAALAQFACLSNATGNWNAAGTWTACGGGVPGNDDTANVRNGHTVSISSTPITVLNVTVSNGTLQFAGGAKVLNINGNLSIAATEVLNVNGGSNSTHTVNITGNITNAGSLTCGTGNDLCNFVFNGGGTQTLSGAGTTQFNNITIAAGTIVNSTNNITVIGTTTVTGTLGITNTAGTKVFTGAVTIAGTWDNSTNEDIAMGGSLTNNGTFTSGTGTYTFQTTAAQSWAGTSGLTFGGNVVVSATRTNNTTTQIVGNLSGASTLTNAANQTLRIRGNGNGLTALIATALNNTVEYNGTGVQTPKVTNYANLTISSAGAVAFNGSLSIASNLTDNGNFSHTGAASIVTFNGAAAQSLLGTAANTTFQNVTMANTAAAATRTLTLNHDMTVVTNLTFTAGAASGGRIVTGATKVVIEATAGTITNACPADANDFIAGNLQRFVAGGAGPTTVDFPVGSNAAAACSRVTLVFTGVGAGGGRLIVGATPGDHPQIANSGLDAANSVNRHWTLTTTGVTGTALPSFTSYDATFNFLAGDLDAGSTPTAFVATRYDGTAWDTTTEGTAAGTSTQILAEDALGQFAVGEVVGFNVNLGSAGRFDAYDPPSATPAGSLRGNLRTKIAGTAFTVTLVHLNAAGTALANLTANVNIELVDASPAVVGPTNNCSSNWTTQIAQSGTVAFGGGNNRTWTFTVNDSWPNVRVKVSRVGGGTEIGCSGDAFAIRPADLLLEALDANWQTAGSARLLHNTGSLGGNVHAASTAATPRPFTVRATARNSAAATTTNYAGATTTRSGPTCVLPAGCATGTLSLAGAAVASGVTTATATYSEAGTFTLEVEDNTFANVDAADTALSVRRVAQSGGAREIGRFVPDRFTFTGASAPQFRTYDAVCAGVRSFTYIGQPLSYAAAALPTATVQAVNAAGAVTTNYRGTLFKLTAAGLAETYSQNGVGPAINDAAKGTPTLSAIGNGTATYAADAAGSIKYTRAATPIPAGNTPFNANLSLSVSATDTSEAAVAGNANITATALVFNGGGGGIAFDSGSAFRYGRVRLGNAVGSDKLDLPIPIYAEHWAGTAFVTNTADNCTSFVAGNFALSNYQGVGINPGNVGSANISPGGAFSAGVGSLTLLKPTAAVTAPGSVDICLDLGPDTAPPADTCTATTPAAQSYLQGRNAGTDYDDDPRGRAAFGVFGSQPNNFIYFRENF